MEAPARAAPEDSVGRLQVAAEAYLVEQANEYRDPQLAAASLSFEGCTLRYSFRRDFPSLVVQLPGVDLKTINPRSVSVGEARIEFGTFGERNSIEYREALDGSEITHALVSSVQIRLAEVPGPVRAQMRTTFRKLLRLCNAKASHDPLAPAARSR